MTTFFGTAWDAPVFDAGTAKRVETPVGKHCYTCSEAIAEGDRGYIRAVAQSLTEGRPEPVHAECDLLGIVGHQYGICSCAGYDTSARSSALALLAALDDERAAAGMPPLFSATGGVPST